MEQEDPNAVVALTAITALFTLLVRKQIIDSDSVIAELQTAVSAYILRGDSNRAAPLLSYVDLIRSVLGDTSPRT